MRGDIPISKVDKQFIKSQLESIFTEAQKAKTNKIDTIENLKEAELLLQDADNCIGGTFKSYINVNQVKQLEEKIKNNKSKSKFLTKIKKWLKTFIEFCKTPSSFSKQKNLKQETEVLINGQPIKIIKAVSMETQVLQEEIKLALKARTELEKSKQKNSLTRSNPVSKEQKATWQKRTSGKTV